METLGCIYTLPPDTSQATSPYLFKFLRHQGRPYLDKMSSDRTEMLYWLQQERRQTALEMAKKTVELKMSEMPASVSVKNV